MERTTEAPKDIRFIFNAESTKIYLNDIITGYNKLGKYIKFLFRLNRIKFSSVLKKEIIPTNHGYKERNYSVVIRNENDFFDYCVITRSIVVSPSKLKEFSSKLYKRIHPLDKAKFKNEIKKVRASIMIKDWVEVLPIEDTKKIIQYLDSLKLPCKDNYRAANIKKSSQMRRYMRDRKTGCCGFLDEIITVSGIKYAVGCNYGH